MAIESVCGNHMNPPMSYIDPYHVASLNVMAGITPVSRGGDSIAGTISVDRAAPEFARGGQPFPFSGQRLAIHGGVAGFHRTNGVVNGGNAFLSAATENFRVGYTGSYVNANNYKNGAGSMVKSTFYEAQNHALELAGRHGRHMVTLDLGYQRIPQQGFVNARMDMSGNQAGFANLSYDGAFGWGGLEARVYYQNIRHGMNILRDKIPGMNMPMDTRGATIGYAVQAEMNLSGRDILRVGQRVSPLLSRRLVAPGFVHGGQHGAQHFVECAQRPARAVRRLCRMGNAPRQPVDGTARRPHRRGPDEYG